MGEARGDLDGQETQEEEDDDRNPRGARRPGAPTARRSSLPRPDPTFKGCLHCGKINCFGGGTRRKCPDFQKLLADSGGNPPDNYKGAFERSKEQAASLISGEQPSAPAEGEHPKTRMPEVIWDAIAAAAKGGC